MNWPTFPLRRLLTATGGAWGTEAEDGEVSARCIRGTDFDYDLLRANTGRAPIRGFTAMDYRYRSLRPGDLIIEKSGGGEQQPVGRAVLYDSKEAALPTNFAARLRPSPEVESRFLCYMMASLYRHGPIPAAIKQTTGIQNLDLDAVLSIRVGMPGLRSQRAIADYLDTETARIDALIEKKLAVNRLLTERSQAVVSGAWAGRLLVGTDGRPMGLDGWRCVRLGHLARIQTGLTLDEGRENGLDPVTLPYLRVANVQDGALDLDEVKEVTVPRDLARRCSLRPGDVLMTEGGDPDKLGRGTVWPGEISPCLHQNHVFAVRPTEELLPAYLALVTRTQYARAYFEMTASKTTGIASTSTAKIAAFRIPMSSLADQRKMVSLVNNEVAEVDDLRGKVERQLRLLGEHRQALIAAAVTGELQVPGVAA